MTDATGTTYSPNNPANWPTLVPSDVAEALDEQQRETADELVHHTQPNPGSTPEIPVYIGEGPPYTIKSSGVLLTDDFDLATLRNLVMTGDLTVGDDVSIGDDLTVSGEAFGVVYISDDPPPAPQAGQLWLDTNGTGAPVSITPIREESSNYTITSSDGTVGVDTSGGAVTITLPAVAAVTAGIKYTIKNIDGANAVTVDADGSETIDGATTATVPYPNALKVQSTGTGWWII